jgi:hypothetical protein
VAVTRIGQVGAAPGLELRDARGHSVPATWRGFDHFADDRER